MLDLGRVDMIGRVVDYTFAKNDVIRRFRTGRISKADICDAHPELVRAASSLGSDASQRCPVCRERKLKRVSYAFGPSLRRYNGRICTPDKMEFLISKHDEFVCYEVEVCIGCYWNHLVRSFVTGRAYTSRRSAAEEAR
ncbi:MAG: hypothetical protein C4318_01045 [Acidimicrobiia bacterium]|mgnify:FL=1